jgi:hypothetical protein
MPTGTEIMNRAAVLLNDADHIRWPATELCEWINEGARAIVLAKPSASSKTVTMPLAIGTRQSIDPSVGAFPLVLITLVRNIASLGPPLVGGRMIKPVDRALLDAQVPDWHNRNTVQFSREVRNFTYDELVPLEFYVYPGNDGSGLVEAELGVLPLPLVADGDPKKVESYGGQVGLPEPYSVPLLDYTLYRCQMKDDIDGAAGRSSVHYQQFATAIGLKIQVEKAHSPNLRSS